MSRGPAMISGAIRLAPSIASSSKSAHPRSNLMQIRQHHCVYGIGRNAQLIERNKTGRAEIHCHAISRCVQQETGLEPHAAAKRVAKPY